MRSSGLSVNPTRERAGERRVAIQQAQKTASLVRDNLAPGVTDPAGNVSGSLSGSSTIAMLDGGKILSATLDDISGVIGGGGGLTWRAQEVNLGSVPTMGGRFTVSFPGATVGQGAIVVDYPAELSNGELGDRCEADGMTLQGICASSDQLTIYWRSTGPLAGLRYIAFTSAAIA